MKKLTFSIIFTFVVFCSFSQVKTKEAESYIRKYSHIAVRNMKDFGIPASITISQGLLESGSGLSELARKSNNHFGIKCKKDWLGDRVFHDDDESQECFRKYNCVEDSYADHALFLVSSPRYADLFKLSKTDYEGWAKGLKKAGYATNPKYPELLINMINLYELDRFDKRGRRVLSEGEVEQAGNERGLRNGSQIAAYIMGGRSVYRDGKELYVIARKSDSFAAIGKALKISERRMGKFNPGLKTISEGDKLFVSRKRNK